MNLVMIGTGYVGLVSGLGYAKLGHRVACVDVDANKIAKLDLGETPFFEPDLPELLRSTQEAGRIVFTTELDAVIAGADVIAIAVGTPAKTTGEADLSYVFAVAEAIGKSLDHEAVIVMKSTVPVGTNRAVLARVREAMVAAGRGDLASLIQIISLPEFLSEGHALRDFFFPHRIVIGGDDVVSRQLIDQMHAGISAPRLHMTLEDAELTKYAANALLATKISFINEIANIAERVGCDVRVVRDAVGADPRLGTHFLNAGIGFGGSCFPKDVSALHNIAGVNGYDFKLLSAVIDVNNRQRELFVKKVEHTLGGVRGRKLAVWGASFKGGTDDVRESAAIDIAQRLFARGAELSVYDPAAMENAKRLFSERVEFAATPIDAAIGADALLILTDWPEFRDVSIETLRDQMMSPIVFDGRNWLADLRLNDHGFRYYGVGIRS